MNLGVAVLAEKDTLVEFTPELGLAPAVRFMFHLPIALVQEIELHDS
jgi:hypothetical protein